MHHPGPLYFGMLLDTRAQPLAYADVDAEPDPVPSSGPSGPSASAGGGAGVAAARGPGGLPVVRRPGPWITRFGSVGGLVTGLTARVRSG
jgi:hypothetical protein